MKLWILGANGLLGSALQKICDSRMIDYVATDKETVDITHLEQLKRFSKQPLAQGVTHLVNCAAFTDVDRAEKEPELARLVNTLGPENVGAMARELGARVIHISTDYVFGGTGSRPYLETDPGTPHGIYAQTKWEGELALLDVCPSACIVRSSWLFGKGGKNFISSLFDRMKKEEILRVVADQKGHPTFAHDLAETVLALLCHAGIYHFANGGAVSRFEMAQKIRLHALAQDIPLKCIDIIPVGSDAFPTLALRPSYCVLSTDKIETMLGVIPRSWEVGLTELIK